MAALCGSLVCHLRGFLPESECKVTAFFPKNQIFWQEFYVIKHIFCRRVLAYLAYLADLQDGAQRRGRRTFLRGFHTTVLRTRRLAPKRHQTTIRHMGPGLPTSPLGRLGRYFADAKPLFTPVFAPAGRTRHWCVPAGFQWIRSKSRERSMGSGGAELRRRACRLRRGRRRGLYEVRGYLREGIGGAAISSSISGGIMNMSSLDLGRTASYHLNLGR